MSNRISRLFSRERDENQSVENSQRNSSACSVPLFMSPPSDQFRPFCVGGHSPHAQRYHEGQAPLNADEHDRQSTIAASSVYSESPRQQQEAQFTREDIGHRSQCSSSRALDTDLEDRSSSPFYADSEAQIIRDKQRKKRRVTESTRQRIASKKRLSMAFGITVLATVITYLILAVTGAAHGLMFHILSILFILGLAGVFLHSFIRLIMLQKRRRVRAVRHRDWHGTSRSTTSSSSRSLTDHASNPFEDPVPEKPIEIRMGAEEVITTTPRGKNKKVIRQPPPVYGNLRESKRMNPEMVFWHKQNPSPTTPTYEEAMNDVQTAVGYQPPQYVSPKRGHQVIAGERASNIHPLERERLVGLMGNTMSSRRV